MKKNIFYLVSIFLLIFSLLTPATASDFKIILNFDDGYRSVYQQAFPVLKKYDYPAVVYIITNYLDQERHLDLDELQKLNTAGWEIGSHTHNHPDLSKLITEGLKQEIIDSRDILIENNLLTEEYASFCSPMSIWNKNIAEIVAKEYQLARGDKLYLMPDNKEIPADIRVILNDTDWNQFEYWIETARNRELPLILVFHEISDTGHIYSYPRDKFAELISYLDNENMEITTFNQLFIEEFNPAR